VSIPGAATPPVRLVLVDDHEIVTAGLKATLELEPDLVVVGQAATSAEAVTLVQEASPDVALVDLKLRGETGDQVCRRILQVRPQTGVVILTTFLEEDSVVDCILAGAKAYVLKDVELVELKHIIRQVAQGLSVLDPQTTSKVMARLRRDELEAEAARSLTERQLEVLRLLADGLTNREIGRRLYLSESTVKYHVRRAMQTLGVDRRAELVREVMRRGILH
jgi:two-component system response regulator DevR